MAELLGRLEATLSGETSLQKASDDAVVVALDSFAAVEEVVLEDN